MGKAPIDWTTDEDIIAAGRDNVQNGDFWMLSDGVRVTLAEQKKGEPPKAIASFPKHVFDAFARWYTTGAKP